MQEVEFRLLGDRLTHNGASRHLTEPVRDRFAAWTKRYHDLAWRPGADDALLALGCDIQAWLDGDGGWLAALRELADGSVIADFAVPATPSAQDRQFLEVPWELAATGDTWLAADPAMMWAPLRRIGATAAPPPPSPAHRLGVMFMAAAPRGQTNLDIEAEEAAILRATADIGLDLTVEDSGTLPEMSRAWHAVGSLDALHLSCHGMGGDTPFLALEDAGGDLAKATLEDLAGGFVQAKPRLVFLSACHTGEGDETVDSLARGLIRVGFPAVLGWADAVFDRDASAFAAAFYARAAQPGTTVQAAWAAARYDLLRQPRPPAHWHLARLFLGRTGGGVLAAGTAARQRDDPDAGRKGVLDAPGRQIDVASRFEFVGRRRQTQAIQREFRRKTHAGAVILGLGRQGKSSLAARIIDRHPALTPVVLFRACDGPSLLAELSRKVDGAAEICARYRDRVDPQRADLYDPDALFHALRALLQGPCGDRSKGGQPILLLLDDFEALLDPPAGPDEIHRVNPEAAAPLAAIVRAFDAGGSESRLLITCRYAFRLPERGRDLAARLLRVDLPAMSPADSLKQARQKLAAGQRTAADAAWFAEFEPRAIAAAHGNAGLQDLLFQAALADREAGEAATAALESHLDGGALPEQQDLRDTLEGLAIGELLDWLTPDERRLLAASTGFRLPLPLPVWTHYAASAGMGRPDRLLAFGLWERLPDIADPHVDAVAANAIAASRVNDDNDATQEQIRKTVLPALFIAWGGADRAGKPAATDIELTRLALRCGNLDVLAATAAYAIRNQESVFAYREAAATAEAALNALAAGGRPQDAFLLRTAAEVFDHVGDADGLRRVYAAAPRLGADDTTLPRDERIARAQFRGRFAGWLVQQGDPDRALLELHEVRSVFEALGDRRSRAVTLGDIARILTDKGDVDQALQLHHEQLQIFEALGDRRSRAVTLGDIARILRDKGDVDQAFELQQQRLQTNETLGDQDGIAAASFDIGQMRLARAVEHNDAAAFQVACTELAESYRIFLAIGRLDAICAVGEVLGRALAMGGQSGEAKTVLARSRDGYRRLGQTQAAARVEGLLQQLG
jgi:hypothetical protein